MAVYLMALWKLLRHPQAPSSARFTAMLVLAYVVSPVDFMPDVVPFLGQLDDLVLIPLGVTAVAQLTPRALWQSCLHEAERQRARWPRLWRSLLVCMGLWLMALLALAWYLWGGA